MHMHLPSESRLESQCICMYFIRMNKPTEIIITTWARLLRANNASVSKVECALKKAGLPPLAWYDVLLEVKRAGKEGIRPFELQNELLLPQYGISRLLNRICNAGYLERFSCEEDGRGQSLVLTTSGRKILKQMWLVYSEAIELVVGSKLTTKEAEILSRLLKKLI